LSVYVQLSSCRRSREFWDAFAEYWDALYVRRRMEDPGATELGFDHGPQNDQLGVCSAIPQVTTKTLSAKKRVPDECLYLYILAREA
jgi:hypothetical protein